VDNTPIRGKNGDAHYGSVDGDCGQILSKVFLILKKYRRPAVGADDLRFYLQLGFMAFPLGNRQVDHALALASKRARIVVAMERMVILRRTGASLNENIFKLILVLFLNRISPKEPYGIHASGFDMD